MSHPSLALIVCVAENTVDLLCIDLGRHHHVESVHFATPAGDALHGALATVQTPHREYYILRENGMQVGCEEDGVGEVWQGVLECDPRGVPT